MEIRNVSFRFWALIIVALAALLCGFSVLGSDDSDATVTIAQGDTETVQGQEVTNNTSDSLVITDEGVFTFCGIGHTDTESFTIGGWTFSHFTGTDGCVGFTFTIGTFSESVGSTTIVYNGTQGECFQVLTTGGTATIGSGDSSPRSFSISINTTDSVNSDRVSISTGTMEIDGVAYSCLTESKQLTVCLFDGDYPKVSASAGSEFSIGDNIYKPHPYTTLSNFPVVDGMICLDTGSKYLLLGENSSMVCRFTSGDLLLKNTSSDLASIMNSYSTSSGYVITDNDYTGNAIEVYVKDDEGAYNLMQSATLGSSSQMRFYLGYSLLSYGSCTVDLKPGYTFVTNSLSTGAFSTVSSATVSEAIDESDTAAYTLVSGSVSTKQPFMFGDLYLESNSTGGAEISYDSVNGVLSTTIDYRSYFVYYDPDYADSKIRVEAGLNTSSEVRIYQNLQLELISGMLVMTRNDATNYIFPEIVIGENTYLIDDGGINCYFYIQVLDDGKILLPYSSSFYSSSRLGATFSLDEGSTVYLGDDSDPVPLKSLAGTLYLKYDSVSLLCSMGSSCGFSIDSLEYLSPSDSDTNSYYVYSNGSVTLMEGAAVVASGAALSVVSNDFVNTDAAESMTVRLEQSKVTVKSSGSIRFCDTRTAQAVGGEEFTISVAIDGSTLSDSTVLESGPVTLVRVSGSSNSMKLDCGGYTYCAYLGESYTVESENGQLVLLGGSIVVPDGASLYCINRTFAVSGSEMTVIYSESVSIGVSGAVSVADPVHGSTEYRSDDSLVTLGFGDSDIWVESGELSLAEGKDLYHHDTALHADADSILSAVDGDLYFKTGTVNVCGSVYVQGISSIRNTKITGMDVGETQSTFSLKLGDGRYEVSLGEFQKVEASSESMTSTYSNAATGSAYLDFASGAAWTVEKGCTVAVSGSMCHPDGTCYGGDFTVTVNEDSADITLGAGCSFTADTTSLSLSNPGTESLTFTVTGAELTLVSGTVSIAANTGFTYNSRKYRTSAISVLKADASSLTLSSGSVSFSSDASVTVDGVAVSAVDGTGNVTVTTGSPNSINMDHVGITIFKNTTQSFDCLSSVQTILVDSDGNVSIEGGSINLPAGQEITYSGTTYLALEDSVMKFNTGAELFSGKVSFSGSVNVGNHTISGELDVSYNSSIEVYVKNGSDLTMDGSICLRSASANVTLYANNDITFRNGNAALVSSYPITIGDTVITSDATISYTSSDGSGTDSRPLITMSSVQDVTISRGASATVCSPAESTCTIEVDLGTGHAVAMRDAVNIDGSIDIYNSGTGSYAVVTGKAKVSADGTIVSVVLGEDATAGIAYGGTSREYTGKSASCELSLNMGDNTVTLASGAVNVHSGDLIFGDYAVSGPSTVTPVDQGYTLTLTGTSKATVSIGDYSYEYGSVSDGSCEIILESGAEPKLGSGTVVVSDEDSISLGSYTIVADAGPVTVSADGTISIPASVSAQIRFATANIVCSAGSESVFSVGSGSVTYTGGTGTVNLDSGCSLIKGGFTYTSDTDGTELSYGAALSIVAGAVVLVPDASVEVSGRSVVNKSTTEDVTVHSDGTVTVKADDSIKVDNVLYTAKNGDAVLSVAAVGVRIQTGYVSVEGGGAVYAGDVKFTNTSAGQEVVIGDAGETSVPAGASVSVGSMKYANGSDSRALSFKVDLDTGIPTLDSGKIILYSGSYVSNTYGIYTAVTDAALEYSEDLSRELVLSSGSLLITGDGNSSLGHDILVDGVTVVNYTDGTDITVSADRAVSADAGCIISIGDYAHLTSVTATELAFDEDGYVTVVSGEVSLEEGNKVKIGTVSFVAKGPSTLKVSDTAAELIGGAVSLNGSVICNGLSFTGSEIDVSFAGIASTVSVTVVSGSLTVGAGSSTVTYSNESDNGDPLELTADASGNMELVSGTVSSAAAFEMAVAGTVYSLPANACISYADGSDCPALVSGIIEIGAGESILIGYVTVTNESQSGTISVSSESKIVLGADQSFRLANGEYLSSMTATGTTTVSFDEYTEITVIEGSVQLNRGQTLTVGGVDYFAEAQSTLDISGDSVELKAGSLRFDGKLYVADHVVDGSMLATYDGNLVLSFDDCSITLDGDAFSTTSSAVLNVSSEVELASGSVSFNGTVTAGGIVFEGNMAVEVSATVSSVVLRMAEDGVFKITCPDHDTESYRHIYGGQNLEMAVSTDASITIASGSVVIPEGKTFGAVGTSFKARTECRVNMQKAEGNQDDVLTVVSGTIEVGSGDTVSVGDVSVTNTGESLILVESPGRVTFGGDGSILLKNDSSEATVSAVSESDLEFDAELGITLVSGTFQLARGMTVAANSVTYSLVSESTLSVNSSETILAGGELEFDGSLNVLGMIFKGHLAVKYVEGGDSVTVSATGSSQFHIVANSVDRCYDAVDEGVVTTVKVSSAGLITIAAGAVGVPEGTQVALGPGNGTTVTYVVLQKGSFILREGTMLIDPGVSIVVDSVTITNNSTSGTVSVTSERAIEMDEGQKITITGADGETKEFTATSHISAQIGDNLDVDIGSGDIILAAGETATIDGILFTAISASHLTVTDGVIEIIEGSVTVEGRVSIKAGTVQIVLDSTGSNSIELGPAGKVSMVLSSGSTVDLSSAGAACSITALDETSIELLDDKVTIGYGRFKMGSDTVYIGAYVVSGTEADAVTVTVGTATNGIFFEVSGGSLYLNGTEYACADNTTFSIEVYDSGVTLSSGSLVVFEGTRILLNGGSVECISGLIMITSADAVSDVVIGIGSGSQIGLALEGQGDYAARNSGSETYSVSVGTLVATLDEFQQFVADEKELISASAAEVDPTPYYERMDEVVYDVGKAGEDNEALVTAIASEYMAEVNVDVMTQFQDYKNAVLSQIESMHKAGEIQSLKNRIDTAYSKASAIFYQDDPQNENKTQVLLANKARLDEIKTELQAYLDSDEETVRAAREYWQKICSSILLLHTGETCIGEKNVVDAAYNSICVDDGQGNLAPAAGYDFVPGTSLREYQDLLDNVLSECETSLSPYRNDAGEFNSYRDIMARYIAEYEHYGSEDIKALIDSYGQKVSELRYDSELSLSANIFRVDTMVAEFESATNRLCAASFDNARSATLDEIRKIASDYLDPEVQEMISDAERAARTYSYDSSRSYKANVSYLTDLVSTLVENIDLMLKNKVDYFYSYLEYYVDPETGRIPAVLVTHPEYASNDQIMRAINSTLDSLRSLEYNHRISSSENIQIIASAVSSLEVTLYSITLEGNQEEFAEYKADAVKYVQGKVKEGNTFAISEYVGEVMKKINGISYDTDLTPVENKELIDAIIGEFDVRIVELAGRAQYDATVDTKITELYGYFPDAGSTVNAKIESLRGELYDLYDASADIDEALVKLSARLESGFKEVYQLWNDCLHADFSDYRSYLSWCIADTVKLLPTETESALASEYRTRVEAIEYDSDSSYLWNKYVLDNVYKEFQKKYSEIASEEGRKVFESQRALNIAALRAYSNSNASVEAAISEGVSKINALQYDVNADKKANLANMSDVYSAAEVHVRYALCQSASDLDGYITERGASLYKVYSGYYAEVTELLGSMRAVLTQGISVRDMADRIEQMDSSFTGTTDRKVILGNYGSYRSSLMDRVYSGHIYGESSEVSLLIGECYGLLEACAYDDSLTFEGNIAVLDRIYDEYSEKVHRQRLHDNSVVCGDLTADMTNLSTGEKADYPEDCTEIWGIIANENGLDGITVTFERAEAIEDIFSSGRKTMNAEGSVATVLADGRQIGAFEVTLYSSGTKMTSFDGTYCIKILLPAEMRGYTTMQVAYIDSFGDLQIYDAVVEDNFLVFYTTHFSTFYLVGVEGSGVTHYDALVYVAVVLIVLAIFLYFVRIVMYVPNAAECRTVPSIYFGEPEGNLGSRFDRPGYRLVGWCRTRDGSGEVMSAETDVSSLGRFRAVKLYAVWEKTGEGDDQ